MGPTDAAKTATRDRGGHAPPRHQPAEAAGEPEHHQHRDQQQHERLEDRAAQILRLADAVLFDAGIERGEVDRASRSAAPAY
jgi:hypothetical protein